MNEGLGELMCRRHFFSVFVGAIMRLSDVGIPVMYGRSE